MSSDTSSVSLSDLSSAGVLLQHSEAVAIAREAVLAAARGELTHIPAPDELRLRSDGSIAVDGHMPSAGTDLRRSARLLAALLAVASPEVNAPATFRLILARALADDDAAYESVEDFAESLTPFADPDVNSVVRGVVATWRTKAGAVPEQFAALAPVIPVAEHVAAAEPAEPSSDWEYQPVPTAPARMLSVPQPVAPVRRRRSPVLLAGLAAAALLIALVPALWMSQAGSEPQKPAEQPQAQPRATTGHASQPLAAPPRASGTKRSEPASAPSPTESVTGAAPESHGRPEPRSGERATTTRASASTRGIAARMDGSRPTQVLATAAFSPAFASSSSGMFYHSGMGPGSAIMRADTDAKGAVLHVTSVVDGTSTNFHPRPSPDGTRIAFDSDRDGERGVYVADANGRGVRRISGDGFAAVPSWSPDGRRVAFVRAEKDRPRVWNIWIVDVATGETTRITSHRVGQPWGAAWFPNGNRIAYSHEDRIIIRTLDGTETRTFTSPVARRQVRTPAVSPDGRKLIFQVRQDGAWLLDVPSGAMHRVLEDPSAEEFTWSPDGRRVAYHSRRSGNWGVWMLAPR